jgi:hypothetical protein
MSPKYRRIERGNCHHAAGFWLLKSCLYAYLILFVFYAIHGYEANPDAGQAPSLGREV